jgi:hypothetical protein
LWPSLSLGKIFNFFGWIFIFKQNFYFSLAKPLFLGITSNSFWLNLYLLAKFLSLHA